MICRICQQEDCNGPKSHNLLAPAPKSRRDRRPKVLPRNFRKKGMKAEKEYRDLKEAEGYVCERQNWSRWQGRDLFGLFDLIGFRADGGFLAQVKSGYRGNMTHSATQKKMMDFAKHLPPGMVMILAIRKRGGKFEEIVVGAQPGANRKGGT